MPFPFFSAHPPPRLFAHRGASGHRPENTLPAFAMAVVMGVSYFELDVRMTRDGHVVVLHDAEVDRTTDGTGFASEMTLGEIKSLDAGYRFHPEGAAGYPYRGKGIRVPTLEELLVACPNVFINIEVKQSSPPMDEALEATLVRYDALDRVLLVSKRSVIMRRIRERFGNRVAMGISREEGLRFAKCLISGMRGRPQFMGQALQIPETIAGVSYIRKGLVKIAHQAGLEVHVWTVNDPIRMRKYLSLGVDGIMTDFPERFLGLWGKDR